MKELTIEEKAKAYDEALKRAKSWYTDAQIDFKKSLETLFPELKCDDEKIRKEIIKCVKNYGPSSANPQLFKNMLAWLEKQGQKPSDRVEPKFHEGDWITNGDYTWKIVEVKPLDYILQSQDGNIVDDTISHLDEQFHSFTIQDAKDGDVLSSDNSIFIFQEEYIAKKPIAYCGLMNGRFIEGKDACWTNEKYYPATKEQRDTLIKAMTDAGWGFDFEKKELKKIEQKSQRMVSAEAKEALYDKPAWSEEDEKRLQSCINILKAKSLMGKVDTANTMWLKSLKDRVIPQSKQEWSEEDECYMSECIGAIATKDGWSFEEKRKTKHWLKSIKDRHTWKPSDEQMEALHDLNLTGNISYAGQGQVLIELYNDLKKLIE